MQKNNEKNKAEHISPETALVLMADCKNTKLMAIALIQTVDDPLLDAQRINLINKKN